MQATTKPIRASTSAARTTRASAKSLAGASQPLRDVVLETAVQCLIELGAARTTTLEVQRRANVSRGALLHHFPSHAALLAATVEELVRRNEASVRDGLARIGPGKDALERAVESLAVSASQPAYLAELELWAVSRTDSELRTLLAAAERRARRESDRLLAELFPAATNTESGALVRSMTMEFLRGLALTGVLRRGTEHKARMLKEWTKAMRILLETK